MDSKLAKKIVFEVRLAGWLCLLPASGMLFLYRLTQGTGFLWGIGLVVLLAAYILATAATDRWQKPAFVMRWALIALFFIGFIPSIPLLVAYDQERKAGQ